MRKVFLLTGFNNWGKSTLIRGLFGQSRFRFGKLYPLHGVDFCVLPSSNDDLGFKGYTGAYEKAMQAGGCKAKYLFSAFCPTKEPGNRSDQLIRNLYANDQVIMIPIEYKWCEHAILNIPEIRAFYAGFGGLTITPLLGSSLAGKGPALHSIVGAHVP